MKSTVIHVVLVVLTVVAMVVFAIEIGERGIGGDWFPEPLKLNDNDGNN